jgi:hypothetical protein
MFTKEGDFNLNKIYIIDGLIVDKEKGFWMSDNDFSLITYSDKYTSKNHIGENYRYIRKLNETVYKSIKDEISASVIRTKSDRNLKKILKYRNGFIEPISNKSYKSKFYVENLTLTDFDDSFMSMSFGLSYNYFALCNLTKKNPYELSECIMEFIGRKLSSMGLIYHHFPYFGEMDNEFYLGHLDIYFFKNAAKERKSMLDKIINSTFQIISKKEIHKIKEKEPLNSILNYLIKGIYNVVIMTNNGIDESILEKKEVKIKNQILKFPVTKENKFIPKYDIRDKGKIRVIRAKNEISKEIKILMYFTSVDTSDFGTNSLHYLEHIMCNILLGNCIKYNASTSEKGDMMLYFIMKSKYFESNIKHMYKMFVEMLDLKNYDKWTKLYKIEQRRLTSEIKFFEHDSENHNDFFSINNEIYKNSYPPEYLHYLLLHRCILKRIQITSHDPNVNMIIPPFEEAWNNRFSKKEKEILIPYVSAPRISTIVDFHKRHLISMWSSKKASKADGPEGNPEKLKKVEIPGSLIVHEIIRYSLISEFMDNEWEMFISTLPKEMKLQIARCYSYDDFGLSDLIVFVKDTPTNVEIEDYVMLSDKDILKKYKNDAIKAIKGLYS